MSGRILLALALVAGGATVAHAVPGPPPDPRRGERLDGRAPPPGASPARKVARAVLWVPRAVVNVVLRPPIEAVRYVEHKRINSRIYWWFTSDDELRTLRPVIRLESGFVPSIGARYDDHKLFGTGSFFRLRVEVSTPPNFRVDVRLRPPTGAHIPLELRTRYDIRDDALFGGTHGETDEELAAEGHAVARYSYYRGVAQVAHTHELGPLTLGADLAFDARDYGDGSGGNDLPISQAFCTDPFGKCSAVPGFDEGERVIALGAGADLDTRPNRGRSGGWLAHARVVGAEGVLDDPSRFIRAEAGGAVVVDFRDRLLILRAHAEIVEGVGDGIVPFEELAEAGGSDGIRGVRTGRLRGNSALVGTAEYRWLLAPSLDFALFTDAGGAFGSWFNGLDSDHIVPAFGGGLHLFAGRGPHWRAHSIGSLQVAWSPDEGVRVLLVGGE